MYRLSFKTFEVKQLKILAASFALTAPGIALTNSRQIKVHCNIAAEFGKYKIPSDQAVEGLSKICVLN